MVAKQPLPFEVGQMAEAKTFLKGFRGAWFHCKITKITKIKGQLKYALQYPEYPGEKLDWVQIYQKPPKGSGYPKVVKRQLMVRPKFPPIYHENEVPDLSTISEVIVVIDGVWSVGDLVDWWTDGCFWSGTITEINGDDTHDRIKIDLLEPPIGEGSSYCVNPKDLRPSLDWSCESGWTVPRSLGRQNGHPCARLIQPVVQGSLPICCADVPDNDKPNIKTTPKSSLEFNASISSHTSTSSLPRPDRSVHSKDLVKQSEDISEKEMQQRHGTNVDLSVEGSAGGKSSCSDSVSSTYVTDVSAEAPGATSTEEQHHDNRSSKKMRVNEICSLNSTACDSLDSTIMDMEELVNRVKWLRQILKFGNSSNTQGPKWQFLAEPAASAPK